MLHRSGNNNNKESVEHTIMDVQQLHDSRMNKNGDENRVCMRERERERATKNNREPERDSKGKENKKHCT